MKIDFREGLVPKGDFFDIAFPKQDLGDLLDKAIPVDDKKLAAPALPGSLKKIAGPIKGIDMLARKGK